MLNTTNNFALNSTAQAIANLLNAGVTMCTITTRPPIALAAKHKHNNAYKESVINVQLFSSINSFTQVYANAVKRNASNKHSTENNAANVNSFTAQESYFVHNSNCFSIIQHKNNTQQYLYYIANKAISSTYYLNNAVSNKQAIAALCTKSAANKMLNNSSTVHNVANNVTHSVVVRTVKLQNIVSITANKQTITF